MHRYNHAERCGIISYARNRTACQPNWSTSVAGHNRQSSFHGANNCEGQLHTCRSVSVLWLLTLPKLPWLPLYSVWCSYRSYRGCLLLGWFKYPKCFTAGSFSRRAQAFKFFMSSSSQNWLYKLQF
jgi:hypothetical protein